MYTRNKTYPVTFSPVSLAIAKRLAASEALRSRTGGRANPAARGGNADAGDVLSDDDGAPSRREAALFKVAIAITRGDSGESLSIVAACGVWSGS